MDFFLRDDFIKLGQLLKAVGWVESGSEAKEAIAAGEVEVNGEPCLQRGKKCVPGDVIRFGGREVLVNGKTAE